MRAVGRCRNPKGTFSTRCRSSSAMGRTGGALDIPRNGLHGADARGGERVPVRPVPCTLGTLLNIAQFWLENALPDRIVASDDPPRLLAPSTAGSCRAWPGRPGRSRRDSTGTDLRRGVSALGRLIDETSTWYLRRSRPRFWEEGDTADRRDANATLSYTLATVARLLAPFAPFTAEYLHQEIHHLGYQRWEDSVHATRWPSTSDPSAPALESAMERLRELAEVGRELRHRAGVKSRIPLAEFVVFATPGSLAGRWEPEGLELLAEELNVRSVRLEERFDPSSFAEDESGRTPRR